MRGEGIIDVDIGGFSDELKAPPTSKKVIKELPRKKAKDTLIGTQFFNNKTLQKHKCQMQAITWTFLAGKASCPVCLEKFKVCETLKIVV